MNKNYLDISVIIPFKDRSKMTLSCVKSLLQFGPPVKEILLISNNSRSEEIEFLKSNLSDISNLQILEYNHPFNYQKINNWTVKQSTGSFIMFLNNDTELCRQSRDLLQKMHKKASEPKVGIAGCLLLYGDKKVIQHAGVFLQPRGMADHLYVGQKLSKVEKFGGKTDRYPYSVNEDRPLTAVTAAVNMVEKAKFDAVGGYDENFIIGGGDVDLCIRLNKAGYQTWFVAGGWIVHKESQSREHKPITYSDFYNSYLSYIQGYDTAVGDPFLPLITQGMV